MQFDREKLKAAVLYICSRCEPSDLGAVKLHKVLYFSDMLHYAQVGTPITGSTYRKRPFGPTCEQLLPALAELQRDRSVEIRAQNFFGFVKKEYVARVESDTSRFNDLEKAALDEVIDFVCKRNSARSISELSHNRAWEQAEFGDVISYNTVFNLFPTQVSPETLEWASAEAENIAAAKSQNAPLGIADFSDFRSRVLARVR